MNLLVPVGGAETGTRITYDLNRLVTGGHVLETGNGAGSPPFGVVSDGVSRLVLRYYATEPGTATVSFATATDGKAGTTGDPTLDGRLSMDGTAPISGPLTLTTREKDGKHYIFPVYHAPSNFPATHHGQARRDIYLKIVFKPTAAGAEKTEFVPVRIERPPVVLLHGLWSNARDAFGGFILDMHSPGAIQGLQMFDPNYPSTFAFDDNRQVLRYSIEILRNDYRTRGIVVTQADVIGHSMGGLLARRWQGLDGYERFDNYGEGDINRLITIDSPHLGATLANLAWKLVHEGYGTLKADFFRSFRRIAMLLDCEAVRDLQAGSPAIRQLQSLSNKAPSYAIIGDSTGANLCDPEKGRPNVLCYLQELGVDLSLDLPGHEDFPDHSDGVVSVESQRGGLPSGSTIVFDHVHMGAANRPAVVARCLELLRKDPAAPEFHPGFPSVAIPQTQPNRVPRDKPEGETEEDGELAALEIIGPTDNASATPGETVTVAVEKTTGEDLVEVVLITRDQTVKLSSAPFIGAVTLGADLVGQAPLIAVGRHADGERSVASITLNVQPASPLISLQAETDTLWLNYREAPRRHTVTGIYADSITRDLTDGTTGTAYVIANPAVATVDADGWVSALGNGETTLTITHGGKQVTRAVRVALEPEPQLTVTASTGTGTTGWVTGEDQRLTFTLANTGADAAENTVMYFTLPKGLSADDLALSTGVWRVAEGEVDWIVGVLAPGANATVALTLNGAVGRSRELSVLATSDAPAPLAGANALSLAFFRDPQLRASWNAVAAAPELVWQTETGVTCIIETSPDLNEPWTEVGRHTGDGSPRIQLLPASGASRGYYRLRLVVE